MRDTWIWIRRSLAAPCVVVFLAGCGSDEPAAPGAGEEQVAGASQVAGEPGPASARPPASEDAEKGPPERPERPAKDAPREAVAQLAFDVDGEARTVDADAFAKLAAVGVTDDPARGPRDGWNLRDVVKAVAGESARLVKLRDQDDAVADVPAEVWSDAARVPVLRLNRRGVFKLSWATADGSPAEGPVVRGVKQLVIVTR